MLYVDSSLKRAEQALQERGINLREYFNLENGVKATDCIFDLGNKVERAEYLETEFQVLMPARITLGRRNMRYGSAALGEDRPTKRKRDEMMFISIIKIFQKFSANNSFCDILKYHDSRDGVFASVENGSRYKNEMWWRNRDDIKLYPDEVEMCDGLGSKAYAHQTLLMIYCSFTDIDAIYHSLLHFNFLVAIVKSEYLKRYDIMKI